MRYREFREKRPLPSFMSWPFMDSLCCRLSPFLSIAFIQRGITPNTITLMMIVTGLIGGIMLMIPNLWCKLSASIIYLLWYVFDCSDGEVARLTQTFSKYGKQLDWMSHLSCHSLFVVAMWLCFYQFNKDFLFFKTVFCFSILSFELINRSLIAMNIQSNQGSERSSGKKMLVAYFKQQICWFPNIVVFFPVLLFISFYFNTIIPQILMLLWSTVYMLYVLKKYVICVCYMYRE